MPLAYIALLALVQGVTEFLPVSSSAHLVLVHEAFGDMAHDGRARLAIDVALHLGTLAAVVAYLFGDLARMADQGLRGLAGWRPRGWALGWLVVLATLPAFAAGLLLKDLVVSDGRAVEVIAWTTLLFGVLLWVADRTGGLRRLDDLGAGHALAIGLAQALALVPGVSRAGIAITAGRWLGYRRQEAARFSMMLSIPTILGAGALAGRDLAVLGDPGLVLAALLGAALAFLAALLAIALMMRWLEQASFAPFAAYRAVLGLGLLAWVYGW